MSPPESNLSRPLAVTRDVHCPALRTSRDESLLLDGWMKASLWARRRPKEKKCLPGDAREQVRYSDLPPIETATQLGWGVYDVGTPTSQLPTYAWTDEVHFQPWVYR